MIGEVIEVKCNIEYVGKLRNGRPQYYCKTHKFLASDKKGNRLDECLCPYKEIYNNSFDLKENNIEDMEIVYENILEDVVPKIIINHEVFNGVLKYEDCVLCYKDLGGLMLSKLNGLNLENVKCSHCNHYHSDNGKFAYTPHKTHLCLYCGHFFRVKERNIGNELDLIYTIPCIKLKNDVVNIENKFCVRYNLLKGILLVNNVEARESLIKNKRISVVDFLNNILKNEF